VNHGRGYVTLAEIQYAGSAIVELKGGDEAYLRDVNRRLDRLLLEKD